MIIEKFTLLVIVLIAGALVVNAQETNPPPSYQVTAKNTKLILPDSLGFSFHKGTVFVQIHIDSHGKVKSFNVIKFDLVPKVKYAVMREYHFLNPKMGSDVAELYEYPEYVRKCYPYVKRIISEIIIKRLPSGEVRDINIYGIRLIKE